MDEIFASLPQIPKELEEAKFDEFTYVEHLLSHATFTPEGVSELMSENKQELLVIDQQIENLILEIEPPPPEMHEIGELSKEAGKLAHAIREVEEHITTHVGEMRRINKARLELDSIRFILASAQIFKKLRTDSIEELSYMAMLRDHVAFLSETDKEIGQELAKMDDKGMEAAEIGIPSHYDDPNGFWNAAAKKNEILLALNQNSAFYREISQRIVEEGFSELLEDKPLEKQFDIKLNNFFRVHEQYMRDFEGNAVECVAAGRMRYKELLSRYSEPINESICFTVREIVANNKIYSEFVEFFAGRVAQKLTRELSSCSVEEAVIFLKLSKKIELSLSSGGVGIGELESLFQAREEEIVKYLFEQAVSMAKDILSEKVIEEVRPIRRPQSDEPIVGNLLQKVRECDFNAYFELLPPRTLQFKGISEVAAQLTEIFSSFIERRLDFSRFVPLRITKRSDFANFTKLAQGIVQPFIELKSFSTSAFVPVEFGSELPIAKYLADVQRAIRQIILELDDARQILSEKDFIIDFDLERLEEAKDNAELAACALISGRFSYASASAVDVTEVTSAREICKNHYKLLFEEHEIFYDEFDMESLKALASMNFTAACAAAGLKLMQHSHIFDAFAEAIDDIQHEMFDQSMSERLQELLLLRKRVCANDPPSRREFLGIVGPDGVEWWSDIIE